MQIVFSVTVATHAKRKRNDPYKGGEVRGKD